MYIQGIGNISSIELGQYVLQNIEYLTADEIEIYLRLVPEGFREVILKLINGDIIIL